MTQKEPDWTPRPEAIAALAELLPEMASPTTDRWHEPPPGDDGVLTLPHMLSDRVENEFVERAYAHKWVYDFDWPAWQDEAQRLHKDPSALHAATIDTLRKLITTYVRKERFCEGTLRSARHAGALTAILRRLADFA